MNSMLTSLIDILRANWQWIVRGYVLWIILGIIFPAQHRAPLQDPQTVQTLQPQVCVHTDLKDEVDEWKIQRSLQLVREMGATTIVEFFPWAYAEPQDNQYNWSQFDRIINHAHNQGLRIIARLGLVPDWARPSDTTLNYLPEESDEAFTEFAVAFATRYAGRVNDVIIWNEPNLAFEWGYQPIDPLRYTRLLEHVYSRLHQANPNIIVHAGALAPTLEPVGSPHGLNDLIYLESLYEVGAYEFFDALAVHAYGLTQPTDAPPAENELNFRRVELIREIIVRYTDDEAPVFITESGWNDNPSWIHAVTPSRRIANTLDAFEWTQQNSSWVENLCIWILRYPRPTRRYPDNWTLVTSEFQLKPIYYAIQSYARGWESDEELWLPAPTK